jgi:cation transport ATPase
MKPNVAPPPTSGPEKVATPTPAPEPPPARPWYSPSTLWQRKTTIIAAFSIVAILVHLVLRFDIRATQGTYQIPLLATLLLGGLPLLYDLLRKLLKREIGSDLLGGISVITSVLLGEYLAGFDNPLLKRPLPLVDMKHMLLGHWGTTPGQKFIYVHLNRLNNYDPCR